MVPVAAIRVLLPGEEHAQVAEAWGLRAATKAVVLLQSGRKTRRVVGDNLTVIRYAADQGGLRKLAIQATLERPLADLAVSGRRVEWAAVRRRFNALADQQATEAVKSAAVMRARGLTAPAFEVISLDPHPDATQVVSALRARVSW